ncbi:DUF697 domain-containing protein [Spirulina subsalsa FACHB-351]|uniref:DUF697 domain-containing protein n=1 Tax=Spirulina subsalsa FACHB-351 TaxID=234711 RepID=A0ABT3L1E4_9CYAN|nr:DUF697 domain-containing protein [Spirulina subsalsa]MCW6035323.1 DUF697 domain-containing protein [Spirulina subsalsa FACHB-351]
MAVKLRKPVLVGGITLSFGLWLWWTIQDSLAEVGEGGMLFLTALGGGLWWLQRRRKGGVLPESPIVPLSLEQVQSAIAQTQKQLQTLYTEAPHQDYSALSQALEELPQTLQRQRLNLAITGLGKVGKTSLLSHLMTSLQTPEIHWQEIPLSSLGESDLETHLAPLKSVDLLLWVITGDLTESQHQALRSLKANHHRTLILFNKQDQYCAEDRTLILEQVRQHLWGLIPEQDIMAIAAAPSPVKVRKHQADGTIEESWEAQSPSLTGLNQRLGEILTENPQPLVWATTWRQNQGLQRRIKEQLNEVRRDRALPILEQYQWVAAATAFANPVPALDILATAAINAQLLIDLGAIYEQKLSLNQAQTAAATLGSLMMKLGLVELSTQTIAGFLKTNAMTYIAGGVVQGISAAYLTRLAGLSLIEYFQTQDADLEANLTFNPQRLGQTLKQIFEQNQRGIVLQKFVKQAMTRLTGESVRLTS